MTTTKIAYCDRCGRELDWLSVTVPVHHKDDTWELLCYECKYRGRKRDLSPCNHKDDTDGQGEACEATASV